MASLFQKLFQKEEQVDIEKLEDQAQLSFKSCQFDEKLFLELSSNALFTAEYQQYLNHLLVLRKDECIDLSVEIDNLKDYIHYIKTTKLGTHFCTLELKGIQDDKLRIPAFVLFPLVKNAFYFGYNSMEKYPVRIRVSLVGKTLKMEVSNRVNHHIQSQEFQDEIRWYKSRLQQLFPEKHTLIFNSNSSLFKVTLLLDLK